MNFLGLHLILTIWYIILTSLVNTYLVVVCSEIGVLNSFGVSFVVTLEKD
jgi:hypothetical protein